MRNLLKRLWVDTSGQDLVEYSLMAGFVAVAASAFMPNVANIIRVAFGKACAAINGVAYVATPSPPADPVRIICATLAGVILGVIILRRTNVD